MEENEKNEKAECRKCGKPLPAGTPQYHLNSGAYCVECVSEVFDTRPISCQMRIVTHLVA